MDGVSSAQNAVAAETAALCGHSVERATSAARTIKNAIVGNRTKKRLYLEYGVVPRLITCANEADTHPLLAEHAVAALGSLAEYIPLTQVDGVTVALLKCLFSPHVRPVYAATRAIKLLVCSNPTNSANECAPLSSLIVGSNVASRFVGLLAVPDEGVAEVCAVIIAKTTQTSLHAEIYNAEGAIPAIVQLLTRTLHERCLEACINALSALARQSTNVSGSLTAPHAIIPMLLPYTLSPIHALRLSACRLLTIFQKAGRLTSALSESVTTALVSLLTLCSRDQLPITAHTLAELVSDSPDLQRVATKAGAVLKLGLILVSQDSISSTAIRKAYADQLDSEGRELLDAAIEDKPNNDSSMGDGDEADEKASSILRASVLTALAALMDDFDAARDSVISQNVLPAIIQGLSESDTKIVQASVECVRSLSRSVKILRRDIARANIGGRILTLLASKEKAIQRCASATLCNLVLEFSPVRNTIIERGGTGILIDLLQCDDDDEVRKNCLWALKNLVFKADLEMKKAVLSNLKYDCLRTLFLDDKPIIRELAMTVVRNLACSPSPDKHIEQLGALFASIGKRIISLLSEALKCDSRNIEMVVQALYVVCNIASGTEQYKKYLLESDIPQLILQWTSHVDERARIAAVWCTINLSWKDRVAMPKRQTRAMRRALRVVERGSGTRSMEALTRQHLPLPASPQGLRILERYVASGLGGGSGSSDGIADMWIEEGGQGGGALMEDVEMEANDVPTANANANVGASASDSNSDGGTNSIVRERLDRDRDRQESRTQQQVCEGGHVDEEGVSNDNNNSNGSNGDNNDNNDNNNTDKSCSGYEWRIERLRQLGFEGRLRSLVNDPHIEVQGRARAALEMFNCEDVRPLDYDPSALLDTGSGLLPQRAPRVPRTSPVIVRGANTSGASYIPSTST